MSQLVSRSVPPCKDRFRTRSCRPGMRATALLVVLILAGPARGIAQAQVNPAPPTTAPFVYVQLTPDTNTNVNVSYVGTFWVQYRYPDNALDWWFHLDSKWVREAGSNLVTLSYTVSVRGREVNNYAPHTEIAAYFFHSSITDFRYKGFAEFAHHRLHRGDTLDISADFSYIIPTANLPGNHPVQSIHEFWAHYRVGIR